MGSGKTALVSLLPRLYDVSAGAVAIDGADVRYGRPRSACASAIAVVNDDPFLFSATRARQHRLRAARTPRARRSSAAARAAQADGFIDASCPRATTRSSASAG